MRSKILLWLAAAMMICMASLPSATPNKKTPHIHNEFKHRRASSPTLQQEEMLNDLTIIKKFFQVATPP